VNEHDALFDGGSVPAFTVVSTLIGVGGRNDGFPEQQSTKASKPAPTAAKHAHKAREINSLRTCVITLINSLN
jgi:hypothetical protein